MTNLRSPSSPHPALEEYENETRDPLYPELCRHGIAYEDCADCGGDFA